MIECDCGRIAYSSGEIRDLLKISRRALTKFRDDGYIVGTKQPVGYLYSSEALEALRLELYRREQQNVSTKF